MIGLDLTIAGDQIGFGGFSGSGSRYGFINPPLADGDTQEFGFGSSDTEACFNADVEPLPSPPAATTKNNNFSFGKLKRNTGNGTATLSVEVPGPGTLSLGGKGIKAQRTEDFARMKAGKAVPGAGTVKLRIRAKGKKKGKLNETGKVKVKAKVTYIPSGGDLPAAPNTQTRRVKLVKN